MGKSFCTCGVTSKHTHTHTQDWAVNNHMLQFGLSFAENFCNKTPKKFSKSCQNTVKLQIFVRYLFSYF